MLISSAPLTRRRLLQAVGLAPLAAAAQESQSFDVDDPRALLSAFRRLRFAAHGRPVFWWLRVAKYGVVNGELTHLYDMHIATIFQAEDTDDGFSVVSLELIYSVDPVGGELLNELVNPYTGARLPWKHTPVGPARVNYSTDGIELPTELPGVDIEMTHSLNSGLVQGGQVWLQDDNSAVVTSREGDEPPFRVNDHSTFLGRVADLADDTNASPLCSLAFQSVTSWQKPLRMGRRPGTMISRGFGAKVASYEELPAKVRGFIAREHPEIARDPAAALRRNPYRFEH